MDTQLENKICSFCGQPGHQKNRLAGGLGAMICFECLEWYYHDTRSARRVAKRTRPVWEEMSDAELLSKLPLIVRSAEQNQQFLVDWVGLIRARRISWAQIGKVLGVSRQAAWERFAARQRDNDSAHGSGT
ncbi:MAG TPA: ClpX C4-type zinc finger protein [Nocardioides sp.]|nr:ClpX C4-type zinc finger protein [Nocardioides sp.]